MTRRDDTMKAKDDRNESSTAEKVAMTLSVILTVALFGFTAYMGASAPDRPELGVRVVQMEPQGDTVHVHVVIENRGSSGYREVTVAVDCDQPAPSATVSNLPATGTKPAVLVCPGNTTAPQASLVSMIPS